MTDYEIVFCKGWKDRDKIKNTPITIIITMAMITSLDNLEKLIYHSISRVPFIPASVSGDKGGYSSIPRSKPRLKII